VWLGFIQGIEHPDAQVIRKFTVMERDIKEFGEKTFDLIIVGGGIYGACAAWDASLRGLSVALLEKNDFGSETSSNSLKIIHGGLRHLQRADFRSMREFIRERRTFMEIAPHLIHPISCIMPVYGHGMKGKEALTFGLWLNDLISYDRNRTRDNQKHISKSKIISKREVLELFPDTPTLNLSGGALWHDAQIYNSERLTLSFIISASQKGAVVANYVPVTGFLLNNNSVEGVKAQDALTGEAFEVKGKLVLNTSGPWVKDVLHRINDNKSFEIKHSTAMNIIVKKQVSPNYAFGFKSTFEYNVQGKVREGSRMLFATPWKKNTIIGTIHKPFYGRPGDAKITEGVIQEFIDEINKAYPGFDLKKEDVTFVHLGLLPMDRVDDQSGEVILSRKSRLIDHEKEDGIRGLVSLIGVRYTTSRGAAEKCIDLVLQKLDKKFSQSKSASIPVYGGDIKSFEEFLSDAKEVNKRLNSNVMRHLIYNYGTQYERITNYFRENPEFSKKVSRDSDVLTAEIINAVRGEMAKKLSDVVLRRTELGSSGYPGDKNTLKVAKVMARELGWNEGRLKEEFQEVKSKYTFN
jgi:glycerol-3-phosphate dehydrogenase